DRCLSAAVQRECCRQDDEIHHHIREEGTGSDVELACPDFCTRCALPLPQSVSSGCLLLLDFLCCLPEEKIRADRSTQNCYEHFPFLFPVRYARDECIVQCAPPIGMNHECSHGI